MMKKNAPKWNLKVLACIYIVIDSNYKLVCFGKLAWHLLSKWRRRSPLLLVDDDYFFTHTVAEDVVLKKFATGVLHLKSSRFKTLWACQWLSIGLSSNFNFAVTSKNWRVTFQWETVHLPSSSFTTGRDCTLRHWHEADFFLTLAHSSFHWHLSPLLVHGPAAIAGVEL